jgi:hypothetical protein
MKFIQDRNGFQIILETICDIGKTLNCFLLQVPLRKPSHASEESLSSSPEERPNSGPTGWPASTIRHVTPNIIKLGTARSRVQIQVRSLTSSPLGSRIAHGRTQGEPCRKLRYHPGHSLVLQRVVNVPLAWPDLDGPGQDHGYLCSTPGEPCTEDRSSMLNPYPSLGMDIGGLATG